MQKCVSYRKLKFNITGKKTKKKYAFGDKITIRVVRADKDKSEIDFEVYDEKEKQINNKKKQK